MADIPAVSSQQAIVSDDGLIWLPYDLPLLKTDAARFTPLSDHAAILNAAFTPFVLDYSRIEQLHVINGCGVALGDAIVGLAALEQLSRQHPQLKITVYVSPHLPAHVREIYTLAGHFISVESLPLPLARLAMTPAEVWIDLADFMYRPAFNQLPMHDFFASSLGLNPGQLDNVAKENHWLKAVPLPPLPATLQPGYTLLCHQASTGLRSMPEPIREAWSTQWLGTHTGQLAGFAPQNTPRWHDLSRWSASLPHFMAAIAGARRIVSVDSAAIHLAAGLGVSCTALFMGIDPGLRVAGYPHCSAQQLDETGRLHGLHHARSGVDEAEADRCWQRWLAADTPCD
ncbi:hypothetical protein HNQ50_002296 [Silvimonas terrae]|uniref:ADP-heptose:LPS heptosyltransferase n=1 Tax=Silvimonas terrae TaxID=300266 RepID=A0A840RGW5_9NEIS|nr:ADP-heptose--LPS heptosyltransferase [Silvimonas terrae]MBB5191566.1 hypothetical protein [Silvimonas terrae]